MLKAAIIGCGTVAGGYGSPALTHAGAYRLTKGIRLIAGADPDQRALARFKRRWRLPAAYSDYREMLKRERPDLVSLCLPTHLHYQAFRDACEAGVRAIFCEKPLSDDLAEARAMTRLAKGRAVAVNYFRRWNPGLARLRADLRAGRLGRPVSVVARYTKGIFVNGSHYVDLARWFWGEPASVQRLRRVERPGGDPGVDFRLRFRGGTEALFLHVPDPGYVFLDVDILTDRGRVVIGQRGQTVARSRPELDPDYRAFRRLGKASEAPTDWRACLRGAVRDLAACLRNGGRPSCTAEDGLRAVEICREAAGGRR